MHIQFNCRLVLKIHFEGIIDLVKMKAYFYVDDLGTEISEGEIPDEYEEQAEEYRARLIEAVADLDEELNDEIS